MRSQLRAAAALLGSILVLASSAPALALPVVLYGVADLGGGLYQYDLFVDNDGGGEALSGLNLLKGNSVFGLSGSSTIGEPSGWGSFAPLPPLIDDLNYFSLTPATDIPIGGTRGGFSFLSHTHPGTLAGDDFQVEGIGADSGTQIDLGLAQLPEPSTWMLVAAGCAALAAGRRKRQQRV